MTKGIFGLINNGEYKYHLFLHDGQPDSLGIFAINLAYAIRDFEEASVDFFLEMIPGVERSKINPLNHQYMYYYNIQRKTLEMYLTKKENGEYLSNFIGEICIKDLPKSDAIFKMASIYCREESEEELCLNLQETLLKTYRKYQEKK